MAGILYAMWRDGKPYDPQRGAAVPVPAADGQRRDGEEALRMGCEALLLIYKSRLLHL